uniref:Nuclear transport factor 2 n=1 Tax=Anthurium amnicola TaxID=1678845 RepID=A0A1D1YJW8_9ARAE
MQIFSNNTIAWPGLPYNNSSPSSLPKERVAAAAAALGMDPSVENRVDTTAEEQRAEAVARAFVDHYYNLFDTSRPSLAALYDPSSMLSFEGQRVRGAEEVARRLGALPFDRCRHHVSTVDCQPSPAAGGILVFVSGCLELPGEEHQLKFSQMFQLIPTPQGSFFVQNDIFRLIYG